VSTTKTYEIKHKGILQEANTKGDATQNIIDENAKLEDNTWSFNGSEDINKGDEQVMQDDINCGYRGGYTIISVSNSTGSN
jgi:hypothetical protein